ncbi:MAG TPA: hypothetical protein VEZ17_17150 [Chitinophagaceae bacterium]|jgi:hypothetical protein|nr:hypothetical protein [Chitinophagaceae bacterium]
MKLLSAIGGGIAGACALTLVHQVLKSIDPDAPRMDLLGMEAVSLGLKKADRAIPSREKLYNATMAGDLLSNSLYYTLAGMGRKKSVLYRGAGLGLAAGIGGVLLPKPLGLHPEFSSRTPKTAVMTVALYLVGGLVAAGVSRMLEARKF